MPDDFAGSPFSQPEPPELHPPQPPLGTPEPESIADYRPGWRELPTVPAAGDTPEFDTGEFEAVDFDAARFDAGDLDSDVLDIDWADEADLPLEDALCWEPPEWEDDDGEPDLRDFWLERDDDDV